ncbi:MAG: hypothetical protein C4290_08165 [Chloroflexota bacterium]
MSVRVRFAPSPTGALTVGGLRSALFNYLLARHHGGTFVLRLEDTDRSRLTPGAFESLLEAHRWLDIMWDEGPEVGGPYAPYFQSERLDLYRAYVEQLITDGHAYRCYCSEERLERLRADPLRPPLPLPFGRRAGGLCGCRNALRGAVCHAVGGGDRAARCHPRHDHLEQRHV